MADMSDRLASAVRTLADAARPQKGPRPDWAVVDLRGAYPDQATAGLRHLLAGTETLEALQNKLERLAATDRVGNVLLRVGELPAGTARLDTIARLIGELAGHKHVVAYLSSIGAATLLLTRAAHEIVSPPSAAVHLAGPATEQTYLGAFLRDLGIGFETERIGRYKSALAPLTDDHMGDADREQLGAWVEAARGQWVAAVAAARGLDPDQVAGWLGSDIVSAEQAAERGVINRVAYDDEIVRIDPNARLSAVEYVLPKVERAGTRSFSFIRRASGSDRIAEVRIDGMITTGLSRPATPFSPQVAGSDTIVAQLRAAKADKHTRAIVVSVDSGGGSATASDLISREIATAQVPVVASFENVAASGGYYVGCRAAEIVASPFTLTGSIGVIVGRPVLRELFARHGINADRVGDDRALIFSASREFSDEDRAWIRATINDVYARFVAEVAAGRGRDTDEIDALGQGRIWSGVDAAANGLIDRLGDRGTALGRARELAGLSAEAPLWRPSPRPYRGPLAAVPELGHGVRGLLEPFGDERVLALAEPGLRVRW